MMETGWLVERAGFPVRYLAVDSGSFEWTEDSTVAIRLAREIDALRMATVFSFEEAEAREHQWS